MKNRKLLAACVASAITPTLIQAQQFNATQQNMTFALVETYEDAALPAKDENGKVIKGEGAGFVYWNDFYVDTFKGEDIVKTVSTYEEGSKMVTVKISNKEILEELKSLGLISDITGYSIVYVEIDDSGDEEYVEDEESDDPDYSFYLSKKGQDLIPIGDYISVDMMFGAAADTYKEVITEDYVKDTSVTVETGKGNGKEWTYMELNTPDSEIGFYAITTWSDILKTFIDKTTSEKYTLYVPNPFKMNAVSGYLYYQDEEGEGYSVIEGSVNFGPGVPIIFTF